MSFSKELGSIKENAIITFYTIYNANERLFQHKMEKKISRRLKYFLNQKEIRLPSSGFLNVIQSIRSELCDTSLSSQPQDSDFS